MSTRLLHLGGKLALPRDAVTQTFALFGKRGSGKTNGATVLVEELLGANLPVCMLDPVDAWWGLKSSFDGKGPGYPVYVFGGPHGDLPLEPTAGALIADLVAKEHLPLVLSMKMWGVGERARFVTDFAKRLLQVNQDPVMLVLEEADAFIPQRPAKGEEPMLGAMDRLVRWGRQSGVGCTIVTQRSAKVNKDVTTQAETLIAFRTTGPQDRDAIDHWIRFHAGEEKREQVLATLATLPTGTAWVWSPEWLEVFERIAFRRRSTYDSAATPKVGEDRPKPKQLAAVDLDRLRGQMSATIERAKADDPRELRRRIQELERQVKNPPAHPAPAPVQIPVLDEKLVARLEAALQGVRDGFMDALVAWPKARDVLGAVSDAVMRRAPRMPARAAVAPPAARPAPPPPRSGARNNGLGGGERKILLAIAQHDRGVTREQLSVLAGYKKSTRDLYIQLLRSKGLIEPDGDRLVRTAAALEVLGEDFELLPTGDALRAHWLARLPSGERRMLEAIADSFPAAIARESLSELTGYKKSTRDLYLQLLRCRQLIVIDREGVRASPTLFEGAE